MLRLRTVVVGLVSTLPLLVVVVVGEPFYQRRDHLDQDKYLRPTNNINVVRDRTDAEFVLSKYGYLLCEVKRRKREAGSQFHSRRRSNRMDAAKDVDRRKLWSGLEEGVRVDGCEEAEVEKAILLYQSTYNLPLTGRLDKGTMSLMSTSRCGNKDSEEEDMPSKKLQEDDMPSILSPSGSDLDSNGEGSTDSGNNSKEQTPRRLWRRSATRKNNLLYTLTGGEKSKARPLSAHRKYLQDFIRKEHERQKSSGRDIKAIHKKWRSQLLRRFTPRERRKRSPIRAKVSRRYEHPSMLFNEKVITWRLLTTGLSTRIPLVEQRASIDLAFRMWSEVIPLTFKEDVDSALSSVDIEIAFGKGSHQNCEHDFDGNGGEIAHSWNVGDMHFDDDESYRSLAAVGADGIYLLRVAVHEIGHVLGLSHTNKSHSIMYAIYRGAQLESEFELSRDDRKDIQQIYGVCKGAFSTVFDWVRKGPENNHIYNTYFFRDNHYWMYENHANRTRYGDPLVIAQEWKGVPDNIDGYLHIWIYNKGDIIDEAYFFKGEYYYKYHSLNDTVVEGWPKLISQGFAPKAGQSEGIPSYLDSVFFDPRDANIYFFKGNHVYVYSPFASPEEKGCCVRKSILQEEFPAAEGHRPLPAHLDAVYYSYRTKTQYFIKGEDYWQNKYYDPRQQGRIHNSIEYMGKWYDKWYDICDVNDV